MIVIGQSDDDLCQHPSTNLGQSYMSCFYSMGHLLQSMPPLMSNVWHRLLTLSIKSGSKRSRPSFISPFRVSVTSIRLIKHGLRCDVAWFEIARYFFLCVTHTHMQRTGKESEEEFVRCRTNWIWKRLTIRRRRLIWRCVTPSTNTDRHSVESVASGLLITQEEYRVVVHISLYM